MLNTILRLSKISAYNRDSGYLELTLSNIFNFIKMKCLWNLFIELGWHVSL